MPTYTINMEGDPAAKAWSEGASALAKAFTPDWEGKAKGQAMAAQADADFARSANSLASRDKTFAETGLINRERDLLAKMDAELKNMGLDPIDRNEIISSFGMQINPVAGVDKVGDLNLATAGGRAAQQFPVGSEEYMDALQTGAGIAESSTIGGFRANMANENQKWLGEQNAKLNADTVTVRGEDGSVYLLPRNQAVNQGLSPVLSKTDMEGNILAGMPEADQQALLFGDTGQRSAGDTITVTRNGTPMTIFAEDLQETDVRVGEGTPRNYINADGTVNLTLDGRTDLQTGEPLAPGGNLGTVTGSTEEVGAGLKTEGQRKILQFVSRMDVAEQGMAESMAEFGGGTPDLISYALAAPKETMLGQLVSNTLVDDRTKAFMTSAQQFLTAILRLDSGAAVPISEYPMYYTQFIPMPGDGPETLARKARGRKVALEALKQGLGADEIMAEVQRAVGAEDMSESVVRAANQQRDALIQKGFTLTPEGKWLDPNGEPVDLGAVTGTGTGVGTGVGTGGGTWVRDASGKLVRRN